MSGRTGDQCWCYSFREEVGSGARIRTTDQGLMNTLLYH
jgi:hypothetical protein